MLRNISQKIIPTTIQDLKAAISHLHDVSKSRTQTYELDELEADAQIGSIAYAMGQMQSGHLRGLIDGVNANPRVDPETKKH